MLRPYRPDDAPAVHELGDTDSGDVRSTLEPAWDLDGVRHAMRAADAAIVAVDPTGSLIGWGSLRSWTEEDRTRVYLTGGHVAPGARRRGLGRRLLGESETVAAQLAAGHTAGGPVVLGGNASSVQPDRAALLERSGYQHVLTMVEMEHDGSPARRRQLPHGVTVRPATVADARALFALTARAWADRPFFTSPTADQLRDWLRRSEPGLFQVAVVDERVVGFVAANRTSLRSEIEDVQVDPDFQRRGLATAMIGRTLTMLTRRGTGPVRLHTEGHDPAGARSLYQRLGFHVVREYHRYRKPISR